MTSDILSGEVAKNEKHLGAAEKVGADFVLLVVKWFRVGIPFA